MVRSCAICKNTLQLGVQRSFLKLPYDHERKLRWISLISDYVGCEISTDSVVCTDHFSSDDYESYNRVKTLKRTAVPTLPNSNNQPSGHQIIKQIQNDSEAKEGNINANRDLEEDIVKVEFEEVIIKDEDAMDDCCECTNTLIDSDVQMTDVEKVEACEDYKLNTTLHELETTCSGSTFDPGTKSVNAINSLNPYIQDKTGTMVNVGNVVASLVTEELRPEDKIIEFDESEKASSSQGLRNITAFMENFHPEKEKEKSLEVKIEYPEYDIQNLEFSAQERENRLIRDKIFLESELKKQYLYADNLHKENQSLTSRLRQVTQSLQRKIDHLQRVVGKLRTGKSKDFEKSLDLKTKECLDYKNRLLNVCQELAHVKVKLTNCEEEKAKLERNLGLEEMRKEIDVLKKKYHDMYESHRRTTIKENEMDQEMRRMKRQLENALAVCSLVGVNNKDIENLDKVEEKFLSSKDLLLPKNWKYKLKAKCVRQLETKTKECTALKKELTMLKKLSGKAGSSIDVCEYCGM